MGILRRSFFAKGLVTLSDGHQRSSPLESPQRLYGAHSQPSLIRAFQLGKLRRAGAFYCCGGSLS